MKYILAAVLLPALLGVTVLSQPSEGPSDRPDMDAPLQSSARQNESANLVLITSTPDDFEGWVDIAPIGSSARTSSRDGNVTGLIHLPFSASGDTKILVNMNQVSWIFTSGQNVNVDTIGTVGPKKEATVLQTQPKTLMISGIHADRLAEVYFTDSNIMVPMDGPEKYVLNSGLLRWAQLPVEAQVSVIE